MNGRSLSRQLIFCLLLISCQETFSTKPPVNPYYELLKDPKCVLPCWVGIEVDKTSFHIAKEKLTEKYGAQNILVSDAEKNLEWEAQGVDGVRAGYISFYEDKVVEMFLFFEKTAEPSIDNLTSVLGEPTWVFVNSQPSLPCGYYRLEYPTLGVSVNLSFVEEDKNIQPSSPVSILRFMLPSASDNMQVFDGYLVRWDGYKSYCE